VGDVVDLARLVVDVRIVERLLDQLAKHEAHFVVAGRLHPSNGVEDHVRLLEVLDTVHLRRHEDVISILVYLLSHGLDDFGHLSHVDVVSHSHGCRRIHVLP